MGSAAKLGVVMSLLGSFPPEEWREERFVKSPPFILEDGRGKVFVTAGNDETQRVVEALPASLGLKKRKQGKTHYLITKASSVRAFRQFLWFARRSWRSNDFTIAWAMVYLREKRTWSDSPITLDEVAAFAGLGRNETAEVLTRFGLNVVGRNHSVTYQVDRQTAETIVAGLLDQLPNLTEEIVMNTLCSGIGGSASEIYEKVLTQGLGMSATYKTLERLKQKGFVYAMKHYRVNERGPMRELLVANCRSCFYGYASSENCLAATLRQIEEMFESHYGKSLSDEAKEQLYSSMRAVPYNSRLGRRVYELLKLMNEVDHISKEGGVQTVLGKIEEMYGEEFPLRRA